MNDVKVKKSRNVRMMPLAIGFIMVLILGISLLASGNTIYAEETKTEETNHNVQQAAAYTAHTQSNQDSTGLHVLAFGIVLVVSAGTAGILIAIRRRNKFKKHNHF